MRIAIASGKGGTGKTTVATNLALAASAGGLSTVYADCDVEEPNGALFLKPQIEREFPVSVSIPLLDAGKCTSCGQCGDICEFNAIAVMGSRVLIFSELCHGCAGCWLVCPSGAISESGRITGKLESGYAGNIRFIHGLLNIGEAMSPPVIRELKKRIPEADIQIIDSPPGTSCPVIESVRDADFILLVTEPTPFGLNDLKLAVEMVKALNLPFAVVINRSGSGDSETIEYCHEAGIDVLAEIPDDRRIAEAYSSGRTAFETLPEYRGPFDILLSELRSRIADEAGSAGRDGK